MLCKCDSLGERDVRASHGREVERHRGRLAWKIKFMSDSLTYSEIFPRYVSSREIFSVMERKRENERDLFFIPSPSRNIRFNATISRLFIYLFIPTDTYSTSRVSG